MAANTVVSSTGAYSGTDPDFIVEYKANTSSGVVLMLKYTKGTEDNITLTFDVINPSVSATDKYRHIALTGDSVGSYSLDIAASGNYRIPLAITASEKKVYANISFSASDQGGAVVANFMEV